MSFDKDLRIKYRVKTKGISGTANASSVSFIDYKLTEMMWMSGVKIILEGHVSGDVLNFNIVDKEFIYAGILYPPTPIEAGIPGTEGLTWAQVTPNGVHLENFGEDINVITDRQDQGKEEAGYWAELPAGLYVEIKYTSTGIDDVKVKANLYLHKPKV